MKLTQQLTDYINAAFTGIWIHSFEPDEGEKEIIQLAREKKWKLAVWDVANGVRLPGSSSPSDANAGEPLAALKAVPALAEKYGTAILFCTTFITF